MKEAESIWTKEELRTSIYNMREQRLDFFDRELYDSEVGEWELRQVRDAMSYRGQNDQITDKTIENTIQLVIEVADDFRKLETLLGFNEPCSLYECEGDEDSGFICSDGWDQYDNQDEHLVAVKEVLSAVDALVQEIQN